MVGSTSFITSEIEAGVLPHVIHWLEQSGAESDSELGFFRIELSKTVDRD